MCPYLSGVYSVWRVYCTVLSVQVTWYHCLPGLVPLLA